MQTVLQAGRHMRLTNQPSCNYKLVLHPQEFPTAWQALLAALHMGFCQQSGCVKASLKSKRDYEQVLSLHDKHASDHLP
jgi:hypothetical protein